VSRRLLVILACATLSSLSCGLFSMAPQELPPVSAPPPARAAADSPPADLEASQIRDFLATRRTGLTRFETDALARTIIEEARRQKLDPTLILAVMHVESRFDNFAVSPVGALGLMQILPSTGEELASQGGIAWHGPQTLFDPIVNVRLGAAYLRERSNRYGNLSTALAAYNWGPGRIDRRIRRGWELPSVYPRLVLEAHAATQGGDRSS
jgi:soluble lytic murein transglycosylase-like protein